MGAAQRERGVCHSQFVSVRLKFNNLEVEARLYIVFSALFRRRNRTSIL